MEVKIKNELEDPKLKMVVQRSKAETVRMEVRQQREDSDEMQGDTTEYIETNELSQKLPITNT